VADGSLRDTADSLGVTSQSDSHGWQDGQGLVPKEMNVHVVQGRVTAALSLNTAAVRTNVHTEAGPLNPWLAGNAARIRLLTFSPGKPG
jgi:hypothetical protein